MADLHYLGAIALAAEIAAKRVSSVETVRHLIDRIEARDATINAVAVRDFDRALIAAADADARLARGERTPLLGVPMLAKESFDLAGTPTTWGFIWARDAIAGEDALAIARLKAAGAVVLGKSNAMEGLWDWQTYNPVYGTTNNPWDVSRTPGGSSGGSAASLAAGFAPIELGSDIAGSLRVPAHFCGVCAHKPSWGLIPGRGHHPPRAIASPFDFGHDLAVTGPMARSVADLLLLSKLMMPADDRGRGKGYRTELPAARGQRIADFRVLILDTSGLLPLATEVATVLEELACRIERAGATVARTSALQPDLIVQAHVYQHLLMSFSGSFLPQPLYEEAVRKAVKLDPADRSFRATRERASASSHRDWQSMNGERHALARQWALLFDSFDVVLKAPAPTAAFPHNQNGSQEERRLMIDDVAYDYLDQFGHIGVATAPGLPATVIPAGRTSSFMPVGVEIVGPYLEDLTTLTFANLLEQEFGGFLPPRGW